LKYLIALFALISACFAIPAHADDIRNFYVVFDSQVTITGQITIDTTTGTPLGGDVFVYGGFYHTLLEELNGGIYEYSYCGETCSDFPDNVVFDLLSSTSPNDYLEFQMPTSLVNYEGGPVCPASSVVKIAGCSDGPQGTYVHNGDSTFGIIGGLVPTPEPSTRLLLGSGGLGLLGAARRRFQL
jgi:PEP-CTERM motif